ncbi:hypothetical protein Anapl_09357 [Anas platyrhynchos]|uniref:Uncharacterized protein n=1 Tax=Anas platyrhynchos TaxID=8839 RepID=R0JXG1_ANAPL|nr:hypothetical protein Anapl_09357 [Anas platyrhynchos]
MKRWPSAVGEEEASVVAPRIRAGKCQFVFLSGDIFRGIGALHGCRGESSTEARLMSRALAWRGHSLVTATQHDTSGAIPYPSCLSFASKVSKNALVGLTPLVQVRKASLKPDAAEKQGAAMKPSQPSCVFCRRRARPHAWGIWFHVQNIPSQIFGSTGDANTIEACRHFISPLMLTCNPAPGSPASEASTNPAVPRRKAHEVEPKTHVGKVIGALRGEEDLRLCGAGQSTLHQWLWLLQPPGLVQEDGILEVEDWLLQERIQVMLVPLLKSADLQNMYHCQKPEHTLTNFVTSWRHRLVHHITSL